MLLGCVLAWAIWVGLALPETAAVQRNDFEAYWSAAKVLRSGDVASLYASDNKWFTNLPVVALALEPLGAMPYERAWRVFWWLQVGAVLATVAIVWLLVARHFGPLTPLRAALALAVMLCFAPVLRRCLVLGQSTPVVVLLLALFHLAAREGYRKLGGALLGLACLVKIPPLLLVFGLGLRRRVDVAVPALLVVGTGVLASVALFGAESVGQYAERVIVDNAGQAHAAFNNRSLDGAFMRALTDRSLVDWDPLPRPYGVSLALGAALAALAAWLWQSGGASLVWPKRPPALDSLELELAIGAPLCVLVFPIVWIHYYLLLAVPLAILPFWWMRHALPLRPGVVVLLLLGLWLASGSEVPPNHIVGRHADDPGFRWLQSLQPLGALAIVIGLAWPLADWVARTRPSAGG